MVCEFYKRLETSKLSNHGLDCPDLDRYQEGFLWANATSLSRSQLADLICGIRMHVYRACRHKLVQFWTIVSSSGRLWLKCAAKRYFHSLPVVSNPKALFV